jgi:hypothetical protein
VVRFADPNDPTTTFEPDRLPAMYAWRKGGKYEGLADDWDVENVTIKVLWILPNPLPEEQTLRAPFVNGLQKAVYVGLRRARTPSWVVPNDPDPLAATQGSWLGTWLQSVTPPEYLLQSWEMTFVKSEPIDNEPPGRWRAIEFTIALQEKYTINIDDPIRFAPINPENGVDMSIDNAATGVTQAEGYLAGTPVGDVPVFVPEDS